MKKAAIALVVVLVVLLAVGLAYFRRTDFAYSGVIEAVEIDIPARLSDVISAFYAEEGSTVKQGDVLARLECHAVNLEYEIAKKEFERAASLLKTSAGSKENYDIKKYRYDTAALNKTWCEIISPIDGKVLYKFYEPNTFVQAGRKVMTLADLSRVNAWVYVEHDLVATLSQGQKVTGFLPETGQTFSGVILAINDEAEFTPKNVQTRQERTRLVFGVKLGFDNDEKLSLKPGMSLEVNFK